MVSYMQLTIVKNNPPIKFLNSLRIKNHMNCTSNPPVTSRNRLTSIPYRKHTTNMVLDIIATAWNILAMPKQIC